MSKRAALSKSPTMTFLWRRGLFGLLTLLLVSIIVFSATQVLPGDAVTAALGRMATPERVAVLRGELKLDQPATAQYIAWMQGIIKGDPGTSLANGRPILQSVVPQAEASLALVLAASVTGIPIAILAGILAAIRRRHFFDSTVSVLSLVVAALPEFVVGLILIIVFATNVFHILPAVSLVTPGSSVWSNPKILVLPALSLALIVFPYIFRMTRTSMTDVLQSDYMEMATLKGLSPLRLVVIHALPNAMAPIVQVVALNLAYLTGGIVLVEYIFGYPGIGQGLVQAIIARDLPTIQLIVLCLAAIYVLLNLFADLMALILTPRLHATRWQESGL